MICNAVLHLEDESTGSINETYRRSMAPADVFKTLTDNQHFRLPLYSGNVCPALSHIKIDFVSHLFCLHLVSPARQHMAQFLCLCSCFFQLRAHSKSENAEVRPCSYMLYVLLCALLKEKKEQKNKNNVGQPLNKIWSMIVTHIDMDIDMIGTYSSQTWGVTLLRGSKFQYVKGKVGDIKDMATELSFSARFDLLNTGYQQMQRS